MAGKTTPAQNAMIRRAIKAGPKGLNPHDLHTLTVEALLERGLVAYRDVAGKNRLVLVAPTKRVLHGKIVHTVLADSEPDTPSFDLGVNA